MDKAEWSKLKLSFNTIISNAFPIVENREMAEMIFLRFFTSAIDLIISGNSELLNVFPDSVQKLIPGQIKNENEKESRQINDPIGQDVSLEELKTLFSFLTTLNDSSITI